MTLDYGYDGQKKNLSVTAGSQLELAPPVRAGYAFQGWFYDAAFTQPVAAAFYPGASATLYAKWQAQGVEYTVEYYLENPETNTYEKDDARTARGRAETGQMVKDDAFQLSIPYYKYVTEAGSISTAIVKGDGSTVLKLYYRGRRVDVQYYAGAGRYHLMYTDYNINLAKGEYSTKGTSSAWIASSKPADKQYERVWAWCIDGGGSNGAQGILWEDNDQTKILYAAWTPMLAKYTVYYTNDPAGSTTRAPFREFSAAIGKVPTNFTLYEFDGYIPDKSRGIYVSQQPVKADGTSQYVVYYMADSYRNFRVEYYFEDAQTGKYVRDDAKTVYTTGLLDTIITAASYNSSIPGYKYSIKLGNPSQIQITTDGLVLRLYYEIDA